MQRSFRLAFICALLFLIVSACSNVSSPDTPQTPEDDPPAAPSEARLVGPTPGSLNLQADAGETVTASFRLRNGGGARLTYRLLSEASWLNIETQQGGLEPKETQTIRLSARCSDQAARATTIQLTSNDPDAPKQPIAVELTCVQNPYQIELEFVGSGVSASRRAVFEAAAARWSEIIRRDLVDVDLQKPANACGMGEPALTRTIDDLFIHVVIDAIDGEGGVLGAAGPCYLRGTANYLPFYGVMFLDSDDVGALERSGALEGVILHEMGHVLGIGTLWDYLGHLDYQTSPAGSACNRASAFSRTPAFTGDQATASYAELGGTGRLPVEDEYGSGTKCGHWDEAAFGHELMTGFTGPGADFPLSRLTLASLADLGYEVDLSRADAYEIPECAPACLMSQASNELHETLLYPKAKLEQGRLEPLER